LLSSVIWNRKVHGQFNETSYLHLHYDMQAKQTTNSCEQPSHIPTWYFQFSFSLVTLPVQYATQSKSKLLYDLRSVNQYVLVSSPLWDLWPDITPCLRVPVWKLRFVSVRRPLWREDASVVCIAITQWSESRRTANHTLLSHLRLPQPGGPCSHIYIPQQQGGPVAPGTGFLSCRLLRLAGLRWRYYNPPAHGIILLRFFQILIFVSLLPSYNLGWCSPFLSLLRLTLFASA
jgi:hypothetical protein